MIMMMTGDGPKWWATARLATMHQSMDCHCTVHQTYAHAWAFMSIRFRLLFFFFFFIVSLSLYLWLFFVFIFFVKVLSSFFTTFPRCFLVACLIVVPVVSCQCRAIDEDGPLRASENMRVRMLREFKHFCWPLIAYNSPYIRMHADIVLFATILLFFLILLYFFFQFVCVCRFSVFISREFVLAWCRFPFLSFDSTPICSESMLCETKWTWHKIWWVAGYANVYV